MTSLNAVDISSLSTNAEMTRRERMLLDRLDKLFNTSPPPPVVEPVVEPPPRPTTEACDPSSTGSTTSSVKYALFALCSVGIQFALHYITLISDTINSLFHDSSYIIKSICLFLLAFFSYKHIDRFF